MSKRGYLHYPELKDDVWVKRWFVIRRPYMYIYATNSEMEELAVVNLTRVGVDYKKDAEELFNVRVPLCFFFLCFCTPSFRLLTMAYPDSLFYLIIISESTCFRYSRRTTRT